MSIRIAADLGGGYSSGLVLFRLGDHDAWVRWSADVVASAGRAQLKRFTSVARLEREWRDRLAAPRVDTTRLRSNSAAWRLLDVVTRCCSPRAHRRRRPQRWPS